MRLDAGEIRMRYELLRIIAESYVSLRYFYPQNFFDIFQNLSADGKGLTVSCG